MNAWSPNVLVVPAVPLHGDPAVPLAEALACPGLRGYELLRIAWPTARVALAVRPIGAACARAGKSFACQSGSLLPRPHPRGARPPLAPRCSGSDRLELAESSDVVGIMDEAAVWELASLIGAEEVWELPGGSGLALLEALAREAGRRMGWAARLAVSSPWCVLAGHARAAAESALERFASGVEALATCREVEPHPSVYRLGRCLEGGGMAWRAYAYAGAFSYPSSRGGFIDPQGKPLFRRQDFPPLYELDYGLTLGTVAGLAALHSRMEEQPGILVPNHDSILLMGLLDIARAEAQSQGEAL
ncbi:hypothetical protein [Desulfocurvibacter africanus]|uniref:Uncharacterized protein n=1 Tax=Desulfocurvibacter africanus subsp. africanus str. Walvis Bay TaxID=690850 RepID=F3YUP1_DESAF|nr:hypothetical protein [Desulfocurvibacter africanus]EGJ48995.1 hypothetical protein Desaf_0643 [Desulfocurvibacter africanus subsp. africanus str. Walvis Bay]